MSLEISNINGADFLKDFFEYVAIFFILFFQTSK